MELAGDLDQRAFPWRTAALVAAIVAVAELAALLALAGVRLAPSFASGSSPAPAAATTVRATQHAPATPARATRAAPAATKTTAAAVPARTQTHAAAQPLRSRSHVSVLVMNGNGVAHAAGAEASRLLALGYRAATPENASSHGYARSIVLYAPGYAREGKRLGHDAGIAVVGPLDGLTPSQIKGSQLVVILGGS